MIKLKAELNNLPFFIEFVSQKATNNNFDSSSVMQIELAVEEAIVNIINYAYDEIIGYIECSCTLGHGEIVINIVDHGKPFDMMRAEAPDINAELEDRKIGGLGLFFIKELMDKVLYERIDNKNILTLIKKNSIKNN